MDFAFLTLATEEARDGILENGFTYNYEELKVSITHNQEADNPSVLRLSTTLVANNLQCSPT